MGAFPPGRLIGKASISGGKLHLDGGYVMAGKGLEPPRTRDQEDWPTYHISALPEEGLCRPYDANGCIYWKGKYHLMYIYQDPNRPHGGHSWGHAVSTDLVNWTFIAPALVPRAGRPGRRDLQRQRVHQQGRRAHALLVRRGAGVCVATAEDDDLIRWKKHPRNPIVPMPRPGQPGHGVYTVWDPYLWLEGDTYYCLLGGNTLPERQGHALHDEVARPGELDAAAPVLPASRPLVDHSRARTARAPTSSSWATSTSSSASATRSAAGSTSARSRTSISIPSSTSG